MRVEHAAVALPRSFANHPKAKRLVVAEADIRQTPRARLLAKLLVFASPKALHTFWRDVLGSDLGPECLGAVNALGYTVTSVNRDGTEEPPRWVCDPRYFCVIGLCLGHLGMEIITHEAVHAGFAYSRRRGLDVVRNDGDPWMEELVAYPAGRIAAGINAFLHDNGLYQREAA